MFATSWVLSALPWLALAWIITIVVVAVLVHSLAQAVIRKVPPDKLPEALHALTPLVNGLAQRLTRAPLDSAKGNDQLQGEQLRQTSDYAADRPQETP